MYMGYKSMGTLFIVLKYTAQLWQKEADDNAPKSEKLMFLDWTLATLLLQLFFYI